MGTPPKPSDPSEVLSTRRDEALKGGSADMLYVEFSVDKDANSDDRRQWAVANPSYPHRTGESAILRMKKNLGDDSLRREGLGIWDETTVSSSIDPRLWANGTVETRADGGVISFCIDMSPDRSSGHRRAKPRDGAAVRTEVTRHEGHGEHHQRHGPGVRLRIGHADRRHAEHLSDADQPQLTTAVANATTRPIGKSSAFGWNKTGSDIDISPLIACTMALQGAWTTRRNPNRWQHVMH